MLKKRLGVEAIERFSFLHDYFKIPSTLIIPKGVKEIRDNAFWGYRWLEEVEIPSSVERIGNFAFEGCDKLEKVVIPKSVKEIGFSAFEGCKSATIILKKLKREFKEIGAGAFNGCKYVKKEIRN